MVLNGDQFKDENTEELEKLKRMSPYQRLSYIKSLAQFYKEIKSDNNSNLFEEFIDRVLKATEDY